MKKCKAREAGEELGIDPEVEIRPLRMLSDHLITALW
jgi:hypothetical protein